MSQGIAKDQMDQFILDQVRDHFSPQHMDLVNESHMHAVPKNSKTHFKLIVVAAYFSGQKKVARQRAINKVLAPAFEAGLHALSMALFSPEEWAQSPQVLESPKCAGSH